MICCISIRMQNHHQTSDSVIKSKYNYGNIWGFQDVIICMGVFVEFDLGFRYLVNLKAHHFTGTSKIKVNIFFH